MGEPAAKTIPMLNDKGERYDIPTDQYQDALGSGLKRAGLLDRAIFDEQDAAASMREHAQDEVDKYMGVESQGRSGLNRLGHGMMSWPYSVAAVGHDLMAGAGSMLKPKNLGTLATGAIHPALPLGIFGTQVAQSGIETAKNPTPGNVEQTLVGGAGVAAGAAGGLSSPKSMAGSERLAKSLERIKSGSHSDVLNELEQFRKDVRAKPSARQRDVANVRHSALKARVDAEWSKVHNMMEVKTTDVDTVNNSLSELAKVDPSVQEWLDKHLESSKSGQSTTRPYWEEVKALRSQLGRMQKNPNIDKVVAQKLPRAIAGLDSAMETSAKDAGVLDAWRRNQQLTRHLENIKHHTAYGATPVKPSPLWGIGGMLAGIHTTADTGATSEIGGAFVGKSIAESVGRKLTPKGKWSIPKESVAGEKAVWEKLGEKPPKGATAKTVKMRAGATKPYTPPSTPPSTPSSPKPGPRPGGKATVSGGSPAADPWGNLKYDRAATTQAMAESKAGKLPQGMSVVQRAQQLKEQMMGQGKPMIKNDPNAPF